MKGKAKEKIKEKTKGNRSIPRWILLVITYLCFVAELAFIIVGEIDYGILFAGLCFCLVIVFFVLWREEEIHKRLTLQSSLDDALRRERMEKAKTEHEQMKRLRKEKEELACGKEDVIRQLEALAQEKETLIKRLETAQNEMRNASLSGAAESILPPDENPADLDLLTIAVRVVTQMEEDCRKAGVRLRLSCPNETLPCRADERCIRLIIKNIIDNTIKYMGRSGSLVITLSGLGNDVFLAFKDDGVGLPQRETDHIFDLNFQGSNRAGGSGLGLAQVKAVVCHYGGTVYARSADGMGIYIRLPASGQPEDSVHGTKEEKAEEKACERDGEGEDTAGGE